MLFHYWTVRYVPDPVRVDTVGVGIIVATQDTTNHNNREVAARFVTTIGDIPDIGGDRETFLKGLHNFQKDLKTHAQSDPVVFIENTRHRNHGVLQVDPPHLIAGENLTSIVAELYERMIHRPHTE